MKGYEIDKVDTHIRTGETVQKTTKSDRIEQDWTRHHLDELFIAHIAGHCIGVYYTLYRQVLVYSVGQPTTVSASPFTNPQS